VFNGGLMQATRCRWMTTRRYCPGGCWRKPARLRLPASPTART